MGRAPTTADATLQRLHEVAERIRRRAAEARAPGAARSVRPAQPQPPEPGDPSLARPPPPRHWSDGSTDDVDDLH